ncbi:MAG: RNA-binding S4 domain-containing protein [Puniceicoccaceae bacterium]
MQGSRIDKWLWNVRIFKSRSAASASCRLGHVKVNGSVVKASYGLRLGQVVVVETEGCKSVFEVVGIPASRVGAGDVPSFSRRLNSPPKTTATMAQRIIESPESFRDRRGVEGGRMGLFLDQLKSAG